MCGHLIRGDDSCAELVDIVLEEEVTTFEDTKDEELQDLFGLFIIIDCVWSIYIDCVTVINFSIVVFNYTCLPNYCAVFSIT